MGLGTKLKNALSPEHPQHGGWEKDTVPGAYPDDTTKVDKSHIPTHGTTTGTTTATTGVTPTHGTTAGKATGTSGVAGAGTTAHDRLDDDWDRDNKGISFAEQRAQQPGTSPDRITGKPYHHTSATIGNSSARNSTGYDTVGTGRTHGDYDGYDDRDVKHGRGHAHHDSGVDIDSSGLGMTDPYKNTTERDYGVRNHHGAEAAGLGATAAGAEGLNGHRTLRKHNAHPSGSPVGGGVYNGVTGSGSHEDSHLGSREGARLPQQTGTSTGLMSDSTHDPRYATGDFAPTSRDERTGPGLAGAGVGAAGIGGAGAAATLAHRHHQEDRNDIYGERTGAGGHLDRNEYAPATHTRGGETGLSHMEGNGGVPRSNLLYPESTTATGGNGQTVRHTPMGGSNIAGQTTSTNHTGASSLPGTGKNFYGPAHEGAKVVHQCHNCGVDNDISHYFKKDAVYRIG